MESRDAGRKLLIAGPIPDRSPQSAIRLRCERMLEQRVERFLGFGVVGVQLLSEPSPHCAPDTPQPPGDSCGRCERATDQFSEQLVVSCHVVKAWFVRAGFECAECLMAGEQA